IRREALVVDCTLSPATACGRPWRPALRERGGTDGGAQHPEPCNRRRTALGGRGLGGGRERRRSPTTMSRTPAGRRPCRPAVARGGQRLVSRMQRTEGLSTLSRATAGGRPWRPALRERGGTDGGAQQP